MGSEVLSTGSLDLSRLNWDNGTIGVGNKSRVSSGICVGSNRETSSGKVLSTGLLDGWLINGDNGSIGVGNEARVSQWVVDVVVSIGVSISSIVNIGITIVSIGISVECKSVVKTVVAIVKSIVAIVLVGMSSKVGSQLMYGYCRPNFSRANAGASSRPPSTTCRKISPLIMRSGPSTVLLKSHDQNDAALVGT